MMPTHERKVRTVKAGPRSQPAKRATVSAIQAQPKTNLASLAQRARDEAELLSPAEVRQLQRKFGNQAVVRRLPAAQPAPAGTLQRAPGDYDELQAAKKNRLATRFAAAMRLEPDRRRPFPTSPARPSRRACLSRPRSPRSRPPRWARP
jgi:hypothetical protein